MNEASSSLRESELPYGLTPYDMAEELAEMEGNMMPEAEARQIAVQTLTEQWYAQAKKDPQFILRMYTQHILQAEDAQ